MREILDLSLFSGSLPSTDGLPNLSPAEARSLCERGAVLVDLREAYETNYRIFALPELIYIPWSRFKERLGELPRGAPLILADAAGIYCREAARMLVDAGYTNIAKLSGGMIDWDAAGMPARKDSAYELGGQCACRIKTRRGGDPSIAKESR